MGAYRRQRPKLRGRRRSKEARTCDGVVVLGRAEEEAVGSADPVAEGLDGRREPSICRLEVGVEQRQVGYVDVLHAQPRDGLLAHLRRWRTGNDEKVSGRG